jgi:glycogen(starch) synthase
MRILMLAWEYPPNVVGGLGRHVAELAPALVQQGLQVRVVTPVAQLTNSVSSMEDGVWVYRLLHPPLETLGNFYQAVLEVNQRMSAYLEQTSQQNDPCDLIHVHDWLTSFAGIALQQAWNCPLIATVHATERGRYRGRLDTPLQQAIDNAERQLVERAEQVIVCSRHMANEVQYFFQTPLDKLAVIPNGVNVTELQGKNNSPAELAAFRAKYAAPSEQLIFTISRLVYEKGVHLIIQALPRILQECPQARLVIAGQGPEADNLKQQAQNLGVADRVSFIGFVADKERNLFFKVADCAVFVSLYEPFGIVALEAMALGCPLVVSDIGGFSEVVKHAETGIKVYPDNVDSTAWGITHALKNPEWVSKLAVKARQTVAELFNWPRIARRTYEIYRRTVRSVPDRQ